jgi:hypothetical protein
LFLLAGAPFFASFVHSFIRPFGCFVNRRRKRAQRRRPARGDEDFVFFLYSRRRRIIIMTLENSIPAWEVYMRAEEEEEGEEVTETRLIGTTPALLVTASNKQKNKANRLDVSCASGHTATTHALSDDDEDCSSLYGSGGDYFDDELLRCTSPIFNIHASILNISTSDEDDEDVDENDHSYGSLLLDDSMTPPIVDSEFAPVHDDNDDESPPRSTATPAEPDTSTAMVVTAKNTTNNAAAAAAAAESTTTTTTSTIMDRVGDFLIDGLCASASSQLEERVCAGADGPTTNDQCRAGTTRPPPPSHASVVVEQDLFQLLGCCSPPNEDEMELVNTQGILQRLFCSQHHHHHHDDGGCTTTTPGHVAPHRNTVQQRCRKIQQLLRARRVPRRHHDHDDDAVPLRTVQSSLLYHRRHHRHHHHHHNKRTSTTVKEQQQQQQKDDYAPGYDSDPDHLVWSDQRKRTRIPAPLVVPNWTHPSRSIVPLINPADVESTMNTSWDLLWHQPTVDGQSSAPLMVHVWLERGTLIHANHMIEPRLMWRADARQGPTRSLWLLHIARIRACDDEVTKGLASSSSALPLYAQSSTSFVIRTTATHGVDDDHRYYYFQAADPATRDAIVAQWKAAIARFAALAVLEDATSIWREFFVTNHHCDPHHPDPNSFD